MNDSQYSEVALSTLRDDALLLTMANEYLCEEQFLKKMGKDINQNVQKLKDDISLLKKEYPGKFDREVDTDRILEKISNRAQSMLEPGEDIKDCCASGELGRELESDVKSIAEAVGLISIKVHGRVKGYTRKDSLFNLFVRIKDMGRSMGGKLALAVKILIFLIIVAVPVFIYLFFTMEKEGTFLEDIAARQARISTQKELLSQLDLKKKKALEEIKALEKKDMLRGEKIAILDMEMEIRNINQEREKIEAEIASHERQIIENQKKVEEIKKIPFMKRLLRR